MITIITPSLNQAEYIEETIKSIINQNFDSLEYCIYDGGSTDGTQDIISLYGQKIKYWVSEKDNGQSHAINKGLIKATGKFATWINSDDLLAENGLRNISEAINSWPEVDLFVGDYLLANEKGEIEDKSEYYKDKFTLAHQLSIFPFIQPACFFKMKTVKDLGLLDERFYYVMDIDFFLKIILAGGKVKKIEKPVGILREQPNAKTAYFSPNWEKERNIVFSKLLRSIDFDKNIIEKLINMKIYIADSDKYKVKITVPDSIVIEAIELFLIHSIKLMFWSKRYKDMFIFINNYQKYFPEWNSTFIKIMKIKSILFMNSFSYYPTVIFLVLYRVIKKPKLILTKPSSLFLP